MPSTKARKPRATRKQAAEAPRHAVTPEAERLAPLTSTAPAIVAAPATDAPATDATATGASAAAYRTAVRDAATVAAMRTNFAEISDRDAAFRFFFGFTMRRQNDTATLAEIHASGVDAGNGKRRNPHYAGSAKATDAGAINRAVKAGYFTISENGNRLHATAKAKADKFYNGKQ